MMWRWAEPPGQPVLRGIAFHDDDLEPEDPMPSRPAEAIDWPWVPATTTVVGTDIEYDGGYWQEPEADHQRRSAAHLAARPGYCGLAGQPLVRR